MKLGSLLCALILLLMTVNATAKDFVFKDMQGKEQRLSDFRGKWVLVNFWATWCPPCLEEIPDLVALHEAHKGKDIVVIGVALDSSKESVTEFVARKQISYPIVVGDYDMADQIGEVNVLPTSYMFDPAGKLVSFQEGVVTRGSVESYIKSKNKKK